MKLKTETVGTISRVFLHLLGRTWRISRTRPVTGIKGNSVLFALWHGGQLPMMITHGNMGITILISKSKDGSIVSAVCESMGFKSIRGSSSRGGVSAARELITALKAGESAVITPDGPKGPPHQVKKGISLIPRRANVSVVPYGVSAFPSIRLNSWDRFLIPLPFAKLVISEGRPVPPEHCNAEILTAAIGSENYRAELLTNPLAFVTLFVVKTAAYLLSPVAELVLLFRPKKERSQRRGCIQPNSNRPVWLHGSSLGELKGLLPVITQLKNNKLPIFVTCSTPAAWWFLQKENIPGAYQPIDTPWAVNRFLDRLQPRGLILAETEFWPILLHETVSRGITAGMVNARVSEKSTRRYMLIKPFFSGVLNCFRGILTRSQEDTNRFFELGVSTEVAGDGKVAVNPNQPEAHWIKKINQDSKGILIAGSTREGEEQVVLEIARQSGYTPVLVPRHENRIKEVLSIARQNGFEPDLWTDNPTGSTCLVVDVKGVLSSLYGLADIAFVGGTLAPIGGHNILEALAFKIPVIVGPNHEHFTDVVQKAISEDICRVFETSAQGVLCLNELISLDGANRYKGNNSEFFLEKMKNLLKKMEIVV